jgi:ADP-heptose:LPS heptosyltransferase
MAALRGARFFVGADTGPLHLSAALGTPVVGLYGPTDPDQTGPYSPHDVVIRNARPDETTYRRGSSYSASMLSITAEQVEEGVARRLAATSIRTGAARS